MGSLPPTLHAGVASHFGLDSLEIMGDNVCPVEGQLTGSELADKLMNSAAVTQGTCLGHAARLSAH